MSDTTTTTADGHGSHDFDFQTGHWRIHNERLKECLKDCTEWETFEATQEASCSRPRWCSQAMSSAVIPRLRAPGGRP